MSGIADAEVVAGAEDDATRAVEGRSRAEREERDGRRQRDDSRAALDGPPRTSVKGGEGPVGMRLGGHVDLCPHLRTQPVKRARVVGPALLRVPTRHEPPAETTH